MESRAVDLVVKLNHLMMKHLLVVLKDESEFARCPLPRS